MKKCFKCDKEKPLDLFYKHKGMADGHLNKCIECTKNDTGKRFKELWNTEEFKKSERKRGRYKYRRLYSCKGKTNKIANKKWRNKYPEKYEAQIKSSKLKKAFESAEKHHWSYNIEHYLDVIWLTKKEHAKAHRFIIYDPERMMYRRFDNNILLDTKESHEKFINHCILNEED